METPEEIVTTLHRLGASPELSESNGRTYLLVRTVCDPEGMTDEDRSTRRRLSNLALDRQAEVVAHLQAAAPGGGVVGVFVATEERRLLAQGEANRSRAYSLACETARSRFGATAFDAWQYAPVEADRPKADPDPEPDVTRFVQDAEERHLKLQVDRGLPTDRAGAYSLAANEARVHFGAARFDRWAKPTMLVEA